MSLTGIRSGFARANLGAAGDSESVAQLQDYNRLSAVIDSGLLED